MLLFQIVVVIPKIVCQRPVFQIQNACRCLVDKVPVVGDVEHGSRIGVQRVLQDLLRHDIQMVCRLVEDQEICLGKHQLGKRYPSAFTAAERPDLLENVVTCKEKGGEGIADLRVRKGRIVVRDLLEKSLVHMQHMMLLIVVADLDIGAQPDLAVIRGEQLVDDLQDRGLAGSVIPDDGYVLALFDVHGEVLKEGEGAKVLGKVLDVENVVSADEFRLEGKVHIRPRLRGLFQNLDLVQHFLPALRTLDRFLPVKGFELVDDCLLVLDLTLLLEIGVVLGGADDLLFGGVVGIVSTENGGLSLVDFDDLIGDPVKEVAVMGDDDHSALIVEKIGFQPGDGGHIQVVCRLVQDDKIRLLEKQLAESYPCFLTAGEGGDRLAKVLLRKAETLQNAGQLAFVGVAVCRLEGVRQIGVGVHQLVQLFAGSIFHLKLQCMDLGFHVEDVLFYAQKLLKDGIFPGHRLMLGEVADGLVPGDGDDAVVRRQLPHDDAQERGLAGSVDADDGGLVIVLYMKRNIL